ncbi:hypothetical protein ACQFX6_38210 [Streptomyces sp. DSM 41987]|uniref:hypothetical protein n=1 Tax=Streptomyces TaxID=1883 RepID=UPI001E5C1A85|nr:hypothetical protein [Streptomyces fildesensis]
MFLALSVLTLIALGQVRNNRLVQTAGAAWLVFNVLHFSYQVQHLDMYGTRDQVLNVVFLAALVLSAALLLLVPILPARQGDAR